MGLNNVQGAISAYFFDLRSKPGNIAISYNRNMVNMGEESINRYMDRIEKIILSNRKSYL